ncbi:MAG: TRAP transporter substrate-binding protein DctP, partial [Clostridiales Family XIII bacterium]|nr:TRAP transporter substrate-binding protein DctP [Clostridiales Family XIII bacterium]
KSDGRLSLEIYAANALLAAQDTMDGIKTGVGDIGITYMSTMPGKFPVGSVFELPGTYESANASAAAVNVAMAEWQPPEMDGVKVLMYYGGGPGVILSQTPLTSMADFKGLQVRTNSTLAKTVEALGGTPVTMQMGEVYEAMRTGVVDAYIGAVESIGAWKLAEVAKYMTFFPMLNTVHIMIMNQDTYDSLPPDLQQVLEDVVADVYDNKILNYFDNQGLIAIQNAKTENNLDITVLSDAEYAEWLTAAQSTVDAYIKELDGKGLDGAAYIKTWQDLMAKYNAEYPNPYK